MVGLERDLARPFPVPAARLRLNIRPLADTDRDEFARDLSEINGDDALERIIRLEMLEADLPGGYAAIDDQDKVCYVQWLIGPIANQQVQL